MVGARGRLAASRRWRAHGLPQPRALLPASARRGAEAAGSEEEEEEEESEGGGKQCRPLSQSEHRDDGDGDGAADLGKWGCQAGGRRGRRSERVAALTWA